MDARVLNHVVPSSNQREIPLVTWLQAQDYLVEETCNDIDNDYDKIETRPMKYE